MKKGGKQARWKIFRPHWVVLIACTICGVSATLDVQQLLPLLYWVTQRRCELHCALLFSQSDTVILCIHSRLAHKSTIFFFGYISQIFAANWPHRLNQLNLSPIIKSDFKHFRAPRTVSRQLSCRWFPDLFLVLHNFRLSGLRKFSRTAIKRNPQIHLQQPGPIVVLITQ